ncbi:methyl-accepting chemotaxis protein [Rubricella aquisinus]|uniref:Methyl-accepting chemotaxis protein n=1 Tax=Rubricella aquisinus TaxID=2028108 RepID=A0A840WSN8_9RHOB|nr:methyl-accepting chemotaxis protein [Rubricella aquisinus]MBB5517023.1 methyl-accepting chemotaxis protein [Rubricella aquisinus]
MWKRKDRGAVNRQERRGLMDALDGTSPLFWVRPDGTFRDANKLACDLLGFDLSGLQKRKFLDLLEASDHVTASQIRDHWTTAKSGQASWLSIRMRGAGRMAHVRLLLLPIRNPDGSLREIMVTGQDFTAEFLEARRKLDEVRSVHETHAIIEFDLDGTIRSANPGFLNAMGWQLNQIVGQHHKMFVFEEEAATPEYAQFWTNLRAGISQPGLVRRKRADGTEIWLEAIYSPLFNPAGEPIGVIKYASEVTTRIVAIQDVASALSHLADGDLSVRLHSEMPAELEPLRKAYNGTLDRLSHLVGDIRGVTDRVESMVADARGQAGDLANRVESQAAAVQQSSTMMESLSGLVQQNAAEAEAASKTTVAMSDRARSGADVSKQAAEAMQQIEASSKDISEIISIIDSIAFQTNLLALNAAVEAARAGEAGRGFSVVAAEVRVLAQRSADAAKDVAELIRSSTGHVQNGVTLVERTGTELSDIGEQITAIAEAVSRIATSSREQATGLSEVALGVSQIDGTTSQTAQIADKTLSTAGTLQSEAMELKRLVDAFREADPHATATVHRLAS